ncbi:MAG: peroxiredoxin [bacterium]
MVLSVGETAPQFSARDQDGRKRSPDYDSPTVVFFYPEDGTPGCTQEVKQFVMEFETYSEAGVRILGVSSDSVDDHRDFAGELDVGFPLLADPEGQIMESFDVERDNGRASRTTFVVVDGQIHSVYTNVDPDGHARELLMDLLDDGVVELPGL